MSLFAAFFISSQVVWGVLPAFWKQLSMLDPLYVLSVRIVFSALLCYPLVLFMGQHDAFRRTLRTLAVMKLLCCSSLLISLHWGLLIYAVNTGHIFQASLGNFLNPIMCLAMSALILKEHLNPWQKTSAAAAFTGVMLTLFLYGAIPWLALAMSLSFAFYSLVKKKLSISGELSVLIESLYVMPIALLYILWAENAGTGAAGLLHGWQWLLLPGTGLATALPMVLFSIGIRGISLSAASIVLYLNPSLQFLMGLLYGETLSFIMLVNFTFVIAAVILFLIGARRHHRTVQAE